MNPDSNYSSEEVATLEYTKYELIDELIALSVLLLIIKETNPSASPPKEFGVFDRARRRITETLKVKFTMEEIHQMLRNRESQFNLSDSMGNIALGMLLLKGTTTKIKNEKLKEGVSQEKLTEAMTEAIMEEVSKNYSGEPGLIDLLDEQRESNMSISEIFTTVDKIAMEESGNDNNNKDASATNLIDSLLAGLGNPTKPNNPQGLKNIPKDIMNIMEAIKGVLPPGMDFKPIFIGPKDNQSQNLNPGEGSDMFGKITPVNLPKKSRGITGEVDDLLGS